MPFPPGIQNSELRILNSFYRSRATPTSPRSRCSPDIALTHSAVCPISLQPELKASAVAVVPLTAEMNVMAMSGEQRDLGLVGVARDR
ncbi:MAG: hypothetical protein AAFO87_16875, partial [Cyanobacteria bacterium J06607_6]